MEVCGTYKVAMKTAKHFPMSLLHHKIIPPVAEVHQLVVDVLHVDLLPKDGEVPSNNDHENGMVRIFKQCLTNIIILVKSESTR